MEKKCEPDEMVYTSIPPKKKCKHCGLYWVIGEDVPICENPPQGNKTPDGYPVKNGYLRELADEPFVLYSTEKSVPNGVQESDTLINNFIKEWCLGNVSHLLDSDENDGEKLRNDIKALLQSERGKMAFMGRFMNADILLDTKDELIIKYCKKYLKGISLTNE